MTTFAQWRSPSSRLAIACPEVHTRKYDTRVVNRFCAYCSPVTRTQQHREAAARIQQSTKSRLLSILIAASTLGYYLVERVARAMSLF